jgi:hypothetical protein
MKRLIDDAGHTVEQLLDHEAPKQEIKVGTDRYDFGGNLIPNHIRSGGDTKPLKEIK